MTVGVGEGLDHRVLVLATTRKDAELSQSVLTHAGLGCVCFADLDPLCAQLDAGAGAVLLPEQALDEDKGARLVEWLRRQPTWSDLPVLVLARPGADSPSVAQAMALLGNVTVLERPMRAATLVSALRSALRARQLQYQIREQLAAQERSDRELRDLLENAAIGVHWVGADGLVLRVNQTELDMLGYAREEFVGRPIAEFHVDPGAMAQILGRLARGETVEEYEARLRCKDGSIKHVMINSNVLWEDGRFVHTRCFTRDVSDRKEAEQAQAQLAAIVASSEDAMISKTLDGNILTWNAGAERLFGYSAAEVIGRSITLLIPPERPDEEAGLLERLRRGERIEHFDTVRVAKDGRRIDVSLTVSPVRGADGRIIGASKVARDATERKRAETALREADRRKDEFMAILAHELRNPLAPIRNSLHILRMTGRNDPTAERVGEMMERQVNHMVRLVDDLLEVSRITRGKIELRKKPVEVAAIVRSAVETSRPLIEEGDHELELAIAPEPLVVEGDPVRLAQVLANLLNNAAKYTDPGGRICLTVRREGDRVAISVRDTGAGIASEMLPRVFELFTQLDRDASRAQGGLGIGLTLVKSLVELHGGSVTATSAGPGRGSEFVVRLSLAAGPLPERSTRVEGRAPSLARRRVLVVDDSRDAAESLGVLLGLLGAEVQVVFSGRDTLETLGTFRPAVVLMDIGMADMSGYEVARQIREQPEFRDVTLVALTGLGQEKDRRSSRSAGFDYHVVKPADLDVLRKVVEGSPRSRRTERAG